MIPDSTNPRVLADNIRNLEKKIGSGGGGLPEVDSSDVGKVLTVGDTGEWEADDLPPQLPEVDQSDYGSFLAVDESGEWGLATPSSGGYEIPLNTLTPTGNIIAGRQEKIYYGNVPTGQLPLGFICINEIWGMKTDGAYRHVRIDLSQYYGLSSSDNGNLVSIESHDVLENNRIFIKGF